MRQLARSPRSFVLSLLTTVALLTAACVAHKYRPYGPPRPLRSSTTLVRGYLVLRIPAFDRRFAVTAIISSRARDIYLPGIRVHLRAPDGTRTDIGITDLSGRFTLPALPDRDYRVCWESQSFGSACTQQMYAVGGTPTFLSKVPIFTRNVDKRPIVYGTVAFADGFRPRKLEPMENVNAYAQVELLDASGGLLDRVAVNNFGEYVLANVPSSEDIMLRARIEGAATDQRIRKEANLAGLAYQPIDLTIANSVPRLDPVVPLNASGVRIKTATPGSVVNLRANGTDPDGDRLEYFWSVAAGSGSLDAATGDSVRWTLPANGGLHEITVIAWDRKGGYARDRLVVRTDRTGAIWFSGFVRGTDAPAVAVAGAEVEVNGSTAKTDARGWFEMSVADAPRFVFNIRAQEYGFYSKIYDNSVTGGGWTLTRATVATVDPRGEIVLVDERRPGDCPGPVTSRVNWRAFPGAAQVVWQDGKGNVVAPPPQRSLCDLPPLPSDLRPQPRPGDEPRGCGPGLRVRIPANSLVDDSGNPPAGNVQISLSTIDLSSPEQMPGDYTVSTPAGPRVMESWGAGSIEITAGSRRYDLRSGATAEVVIPVDRAQLDAGAPLPPTIPILFYDERNGVWVEEGTATLTGREYVARVRHFSSINADVIFTNQSCVRVLSPTLPASYDMEVTIPSTTPGGAPIVLTRSITNTSPSEHVIYNLQSNVNIVIVPIDTSVTPNVPIGTFVVNTGNPQVPPTPNYPVGPPYGACQSTVTLTLNTYPDETTLPTSGLEFLKGLSSFEATNITELQNSDPSNPLIAQLDAATTAYYDRIDPRNKRPTLNDFITVNGLGGASEIRVAFANTGDLSFGRDMHCAKAGTNVACYVTNYGDITTPDQVDANDAAAANPSGGSRGVTVAMEYSPIENPPADPNEFTDLTPHVKFYVYNVTGTAKQNAANLDGRGARPIPQLCMVCHNGAYPGGSVVGAAPPFNSVNDVKLGSRFLPFDLRYYTFPTVAGFDKASQQAEMKDLNEQIVNVGNPGPSTTEIITRWYASGPDQDENDVVPGWSAEPLQQAMYRNVVAPTCRTCHTAQVFASLQFKQHTELQTLLGSAEIRVCQQHVMPHALATHRIFWNSVGPHMPAQLQLYGDAYGAGTGWAGNLCGVYTPATSPTFFASTIQPIFNTYGCPACHNGGSPPAGLSLASAVAYSSIVNVPSTQLLSMFRVTPFSSANSYLLHKINGTQGAVGGSGGRMPLGCSGASCVSAGDTTIITNWINGGASP